MIYGAVAVVVGILASVTNFVTGVKNSSLVHHAGKDASKGARGWSGIKAAVDAEIEVIRDDENGTRTVHVSKVKDGEDGARWGFKLDVVSIGIDQDGDEVTSCAVQMCDTFAAPETRDTKTYKKLGKIEAHVIEMIDTIDSSISSMNMLAFVRLCRDGIPAPEEGKRDTRRQTVIRAIATLKKEKDPPFVLENGRVLFLRS